MPNSAISIVVPVYNNVTVLSKLVCRLQETLKNLNTEYEIILVIDCINQRTWEMATSLCRNYVSVRAIRLTRNFGQHNATLCGLRAARFPLTVTLDDDLEQPPEAISEMLLLLTEATDIVYAVPHFRKYSPVHHFLSQLSRRSLYLFSRNSALLVWSPYRLLRTHLRESFSDFSGSSFLLDVLLSQSTDKIRHLSISFSPPSKETTAYTFEKRGEQMLLALGISKWLFPWTLFLLKKRTNTTYKIREIYGASNHA